MIDLPVAKIIVTALITPACPTIQPDLKKTITPKILIKQEVNTPSHVPNNTGCDMKKFDFHQGTSPYRVNYYRVELIQNYYHKSHTCSSAKSSFAPEA